MKKLLFTLAAVLAGITAQAGQLDLWLTGDAAVFDAEKKELKLSPSAGTAAERRATIHIAVGNLTNSVKAFQFGYIVKDADGTQLTTSAPSPVRNYKTGGMIWASEGPSLLTGNSLAENYDTPLGGDPCTFSLLGSNASKSVFWLKYDEILNFYTSDEAYGYYDEDSEEYVDPIVPESWYTYPANVLSMTVMCTTAWDSEYVTYEICPNSWKFVMEDGSDFAPDNGSDPELLGSTLNFKVVNADKQTSAITGTVEIGERNGYEVPITVTGAPEGYVLTVTVAKDGGEAKTVTVNDGKIVLDEDPAYGSYVVTATVTCDGYTGELTDTETFIIGQQTTDTPTISYDDVNYVVTATGKGTVTLVVDGKTITGEGTATYTFTQGTEDKTYTATATAQEAGKLVSEEVSTECFVPALPMSADPKVTVEETGDYVTITATGNGAVTLVVNGYETLTDEDGSLYVVIPKKEQDGDWTVDYTATNTETGKQTATVTGTATITPADKKASADPVFSGVTYDDDYAYITVTGENISGITVNGAEATIADNVVKIERPAYNADALTVTVTATNTQDGWYNPTTKTSGEYTINPKGEKVYTVETPDVTAEQNATAMVITATNNDPYATVVLYVTTYAEDGTPTTTAYPGGTATIARGNEDQMISYYATATVETAPEGYDSFVNATTDATTVWVDALPKLEGNVNVTVDENGKVSVTYDGNENVTIVFTPEQLDEYGDYTVEYTITAEGYQTLTGKETVEYVDPLQDLKGTVTVTVDNQGNIIPQYAPAAGEEDLQVTVTVTPNKMTEYGTVNVTVTVTAEGYHDLVVPTTATWTDPGTQQTASPSSAKENKVVKEDNVYYNTYTITLNTTDPDNDADIYYRVGVGTTKNDDGTWNYEYPDTWTLYTGPFTYTEEGSYMVEAYAIAPNKTESDHIWDGFTVSEAVSIEELFADKDLAGVRYYNLAGQEMQEANGICIAVYNFTDGTQVAVKVMK